MATIGIYPTKTDMNNVTVILIPDWVYRICQRNNITVKELITNKESFTKYLSTEDQITFLSLQSFGYDIFRRHLNTEAVGISDSILYLLNSLQLTNSDSAYLLSMNDEYVNTIRTRLFSESAFVNQDGSNKPLVFDIERDAIGLVLSPGQIYINGNTVISNDFQIRALEEVLKRLYIYLPQAVVQATVWFKLYVDMLAEKTAY